MAIERAAVLGAGVMGSGIAAQIANAGIPVLLLDVVPEGADDRNARARRARADAEGRSGAVHEPAGGAPGHAGQSRGRPRKARRGRLDRRGVVENLEIKRALYARLEKVRKRGSIVSSNTSTLPLARLTEGLPASRATS